MNTLLSISDILAQKHPDIMGTFKEFSHSLDDNEFKPIVMFDLGQTVGKKIFLKKYKKVSIDDSIAQALKKLVLPTIKPFALAKIKENELHIAICPFCIHIKEATTVAQCDFLTGLIDGLVGSTQQVSVVEVKCRARKDPACVFQINRQY